MRKQIYCLQSSCVRIYKVTREDSGGFILMWFDLFRLTWSFYYWKVSRWLAGSLALISIVFSHLLCALCFPLCQGKDPVPVPFEYSKTSGVFFSLLFTGPLLVLPPEPRLEELTLAPALTAAAALPARSSMAVGGERL